MARSEDKNGQFGAAKQHGLAILVVVIGGVGVIGCGSSGKSPDDPAPATGQRASKSARLDSRDTHPVQNRADDSKSKSVPATGDGLGKSPSPNPVPNKTVSKPPTPRPETKPEPKVQQVFRPNDDRPQHDDNRLASFGVRRFESKRLVLYTDIPAATAQGLVGVVDLIYPAWIEYFGKLAPARDGSEFQITGYIMTDREKFKRLGLIPNDLRPFINGRHRRYEFWMFDQESDYYRRHLILHEATHCFMTILEHESNVPDVWYLEGMAELFATHEFDDAGNARFRIMPQDKADFPGLGRIRIVQEAVAENRAFNLNRVLSMRATEFLRNEPYGWSWAICQFFDKHPRYRDRFRELGRFTSRRAFQEAFRERFQNDLPAIDTEWRLFVRSLDDGYDVARSAIDFRAGRTVSSAIPATCKIAADRGWQSSGAMLEKGRTYTLSANGRVSLADVPKPWVSEPQGITFRYFGAQPIGRVIACIHANDATGVESMATSIPIGRYAKFTAPNTGTLYLRVNDAWNSLANNKGEYTVSVSTVE